jgi:hypothetical protein
MGDPAIYTNDFTRLLPAAQFFALGSWTMYVYWIVGLCFMGGVSYFLYTGLDRQVAGTLFFLLGFILLYYYYIKWFVVGLKNQAFAQKVTPCPDYLTQVIQGSGTTAKTYCVDTVGVSTNGVLAKCTTDPMTCSNSPSLRYEPPTTFDSSTLATVKGDLVTKGLVWTSLFGDM